MAQSKIASLAKWLAGALFVAFAAYVGQLYATINADKAQNQSRQLDIQQTPELSWGSHLPDLPNVRATFSNTQTNAKIEQIVGSDIALYNYTDRAASDVQIDITARNPDGSRPVFVGARVRNGGIEDVAAEKQITPLVNGDTLAFSFKVPTVLQSDGANQDRSFQFYFAGKVAPVLAVSAGAPGFGWRAWDWSHASESQLAKLSLWQRFSSQLVGGAMIVTGWIVLILLLSRIPDARRREKARMAIMTDNVDRTLKAANLKDLADDERRKLASDISFNCWSANYDAMKGLEKAFASKPERVV